jgi:hypothetical protein
MSLANKEKRNNEKINQIIENKSSGKNNQKKYQELFELYKAQKTKKEILREKIISEREKKELAECSFSPKLNKKNNGIFTKKQNQAITKEERINYKKKEKKLLKSHTSTENLIDRQNKWLENKKNKLNKKIVAEAIKTVEGCVFKPEIKKLNKKTKSNFGIESQLIVERPDSYLNFVNRNKKYRENKNKSRDYEFPISKNRKSPLRSKIIKNNDYDYTKHQLTDNSYLLKSNNSSNNNQKNITVSNESSFKSKEIIRANKSIPISKLKITNMSNDELYSIIYLNEKEKIEKNIYDYTQENIEKLFGDKKQIFFKKAIDDLHHVLTNLNLDEDEEENNIITISKYENQIN